MIAVLAIAAAIAASTTVGVLAERRHRERASEVARRGMLGVLYFVLPPVAFLNLARADITEGAIAALGIAVFVLAVVATATWFIGSRLLGLRPDQVGAMICGVLIVNTGYLGYAMVGGLLGLPALGEAVAYDVVVSGVGLLIGGFSVGAAFGTRAGETVGQRVAAFFTRNPALYAAVLGVLAPQGLAPDVLVDLSRVAIVGVLPLGFFAVGVALAQEAEEGAFRFPPRFDAPIGVVVGLRLVVAPALLLALTLPLEGVPDSYYLLAAMPSGLNAIIVAHAYGLDLRIAAGAISWTTVLAVAGALVVAGLGLA